MTRTLRTLAFLGTVLLSVSAWGAITYIDAVPNLGSGGNTTINGAPVDASNLVTGSGGSSGAVQTDGKWYYRQPTSGTSGANTPNNNDFWETDGSSGGGVENAPPLITTITVPAPGTYKLYVMFMNNVGADTANPANNYDIEAAVAINGGAPGAPQWFNYQSTDHATRTSGDVVYLPNPAGATFDTATSSPSTVLTRWTGPATWHMTLGYLGEFNLTSTTVAFNITGPEIGDNPLTPGNPANPFFFQRTFYEGVAFELAPPPAIPGDFNSDGDVDGGDFVAWQTNFPKATGATLTEGDADHDGDVDGADFVVWQTNYPFAPSPGATPVPEPSAICLAVGGLMGLVIARLRRAKHSDSGVTMITVS